jgi:glycosyltransferase involved in cell wall biosynthesis
MIACRLCFRFARASNRLFVRERAAGIAVVCDALLRVAVEHAVGLAESGHDATLVYTHRPAARLGDFGNNESERDACIERALQAGVRVIGVPVWSTRRAISDVISLWRALRRQRLSALIVHSHYDPRFALLGFAWPTLVVIHDPQPHSGDEASARAVPVRAVTCLVEATARCIMLHSDRLVPQLRAGLRSHPRIVVPHGCVPASNPVPVPDIPRCVMVGRMYYYKGADVGVAAFEQIACTRPDCRMTIAGAGPVATELAGRPEIPNLTIRDGYIEEVTLDTILRSATLVLLPYRDATQSGVGLKAIALGIPCVVSNVGALPDLVPENLRGLVVAPGSSSELARAVLTYLDHDGQLRRQILDLAKQFSWSHVAQMITEGLRDQGMLGSDFPRGRPAHPQRDVSSDFR